MTLPHDIRGHELANRLEHYGYQSTRQTGSHIYVVSSARGNAHHLTIPAQRHIKIGTLSGILKDVAHYLEMDHKELAETLFRG